VGVIPGYLLEFQGKSLFILQSLFGNLQDQLFNDKIRFPMDIQIFPGGEAGKQVHFQVAYPVLKSSMAVRYSST
jgi:hypothetical protein